MVRVVSPARNEEHAWRREEEMVFEPNRRDVPEASPEVSAAAVAAEDMIQFEFWPGLCSFFGEVRVFCAGIVTCCQGKGNLETNRYAQNAIPRLLYPISILLQGNRRQLYLGQFR